MTTAKTPETPPFFQLPDPLEIQDEKLTASQHLSLNGNAYHLAQHLGNPATTIVGAERYVTPMPTSERADMTGMVYPDLLVAFNSGPDLYMARNGYVISEQGKPPDFVLEIASRSTGRRDTVDQRIAYAGLGIPEYWRFDQDGQYHGTRLAGDRLVGARYEPIPIDELPDESLQGHSDVLNLYLRWADRDLLWCDPATGEPIASLESVRRDLDQERHDLAQERQARIQTESRVRELEARLRQLHDE